MRKQRASWSTLTRICCAVANLSLSLTFMEVLISSRSNYTPPDLCSSVLLWEHQDQLRMCMCRPWAADLCRGCESPGGHSLQSALFSEIALERTLAGSIELYLNSFRNEALLSKTAPQFIFNSLLIALSETIFEEGSCGNEQIMFFCCFFFKSAKQNVE